MAHRRNLRSCFSRVAPFSADPKQQPPHSSWSAGGSFYLRNFVTEPSERLDAITYSALKTDMGTLAQSDIINMNDGAERNAIYEKIAAEVDAAAAAYGIHVEDVRSSSLTCRKAT